MTEDPASIDYDGDYRSNFNDFYDLMTYRVTRILLVSSLYDAFTLEEEGLLFEQISEEYRDLALSSPPQVIRVSSGEKALMELDQGKYDLIVTMARLPDMDPYEFGKKAKQNKPDIPVILLLTDMGDIPIFHTPGRVDGIDKVFFWNGDSALFMAIIKYVEDRLNIVNDMKTGHVKALLIVEDSPRYYSIFLPMIYKEIMGQTLSLMTLGLNEQEKILRRRARPKILLAETYEEGMELFKRFRGNILGIISDLKYPKDGEKVDDAGFQLAEAIGDEVPILLQSTQLEHEDRARAMGIPFIHKKSKTLKQGFGKFFRERLGFGDFIFMLSDGTEIDRAGNIREFIERIRTVPAVSLRYHGNRNQFSNWLMARGEVSLAGMLRRKSVSDFKTDEEMREFLLNVIKTHRREKQLGIIMDFPRQNFEFEQTFTRLGGGSLGGKGRGIAFLSSLLSRSGHMTALKECRIMLPETLVIATDEYDRFMNENDIQEAALEDLEDGRIKELFLDTSFNDRIKDDLRRYLKHMTCPMAVRSSSLLEDSQNQPFAGIYTTYFLPNNHPDEDIRLDQLLTAVKLVYSSVFSRKAKAYFRTLVQLPEEEKMAIVIQKLVGNQHGSRFYPMISGLAQSHNFYPVPPLKREDGVANVALGLGKIVVEGEQVMNFSPEHPETIPGFNTPGEIMANSQKHFYALNMDRTEFDLSRGEEETLLTLNIEKAEESGALDYLASTFDANDNRMRDGTTANGPRAITFAGVLKYDMIPLARILKNLLSIGRKGMGRTVELEFGTRMGDDGIPEFHALQIRPFITMKEKVELTIGEDEKGAAVIRSEKVMGNGRVDDIRDIIFVPPDTFDSSMTREIANEIGKLNGEMEGRPYLLIGPGRWGTRDRWLGIPADWDQISNARVIVEYSTEDFRVDPSHGTHFFHNLTSRGIPYFTLTYGSKEAHLDWSWFKGLRADNRSKMVDHVRLEKPITVKVDGRNGTGVVLKQ
ncbi:MAG: phosphoenolpyruvate synthase [Thermoplasmata archaeon]|nr:phosphoenolpyruvate synthase [Thermoplasmata archaeon]